MKAVTEFSVFTIKKAIETKTALAAEGKTPEEIQENLGKNHKLEGEKLTYFVQSLEVAASNSQNLRRILVVKFGEGETAPANAVKVEEVHFIPEFFVPASSVTAKPAAAAAKGGRPGGRGGKGGDRAPKSSPWGLSPEEKALKNKKQVAPAK